MKKASIFLVIAVIFAGIYLAEKKHSNNPTPYTKMGAILPLSGDLASLGDEAQKGIELAVEKANAKGANIDVVYEDDDLGGLNPSSIVEAANKLINVDKADAAITLIIEETKPIAPLFNNHKIPLLTIWDSNSFIQQAGPYMFSNGFSTEKDGALMGEYAFQHFHADTIAIVRHIDPAVDLWVEGLRQKFTELGGKIVYDEAFPITTTDYRLSIAKIKQLHPDAVYLPMIPPSSISFLIQAKQLGMPGVWLSADAIIQNVIDGARGAAEGLYFANIYSDREKEISEMYKEKYKSESPAPTIVAISYEAAEKLIESMKDSKASGETIRDSLERIFGPTRSADRVEKVFKVANGRPMEVQ